MTNNTLLDQYNEQLKGTTPLDEATLMHADGYDYNESTHGYSHYDIGSKGGGGGSGGDGDGGCLEEIIGIVGCGVIAAAIGCC